MRRSAKIHVPKLFGVYSLGTRHGAVLKNVPWKCQSWVCSQLGSIDLNALGEPVAGLVGWSGSAQKLVVMILSMREVR